MKTRLKLEDRLLIEQLIRLNYKENAIPRIIDVSPSTIFRELKKRRIPDENKLEECEKKNFHMYV